MTKILVISAVIHLVLVVILPLVPLLDRRDVTGYDVYAVELVELPRQTAPAPAAAEPEVEEPQPVVEKQETAPAEEEPRIPDEPVRRPKRAVATPPKQVEKSLEERIEERMRAQDQQRRPAEQGESEPAVQPEPVGQTAVRVSRFPYGWYLSVIQGKVSSNWKQPSARLLADDSLTALVSFRIRRDGSIEAVTVRRGSGRSTVDQSAVKAVRDSAPFPPLPNDYLENMLDVTIEFTVTAG